MVSAVAHGWRRVRGHQLSARELAFAKQNRVNTVFAGVDKDGAGTYTPHTEWLTTKEGVIKRQTAGTHPDPERRTTVTGEYDKSGRLLKRTKENVSQGVHVVTFPPSSKKKNSRREKN